MKEKVMASWEVLRCLEHHKKIRELEKQVRSTFKQGNNNVESITRKLHQRAEKTGSFVYEKTGNNIAC